MSEIFTKMDALAKSLVTKLEASGDRTEVNSLTRFPWENHVFKSSTYRRAHIEVLDVRETKKMWIMHICIFPHLDDSSPIFGFDVICGANKITGIFHDFSASGDFEHPMLHWFRDQVKELKWKKDRELPAWGKLIFSESMISAGNVNTDAELETIINVATANLDYYLANVGKTRHNTSFAPEHNYYCHNQKQNRHTARFLINCGFSSEDVSAFIDRYLFPEVAMELQ